MLWDAIKRFRDRTYEEYRKKHEADRPEWMETVMRIHEDSDFLFYYDESLEEKPWEGTLLVKGELVKGSGEEGRAGVGGGGDKSRFVTVDLCSGQGEVLGHGRILSDPAEKESERRGLFTGKREEFKMELLSWRELPLKEMSRGQKNKSFRELSMLVSLISHK